MKKKRKHSGYDNKERNESNKDSKYWSALASPVGYLPTSKNAKYNV
jgi:hypothetical protein